MTYLSDRLRSFAQPKPRYRCEHVQAGALTAARVATENAIADLCYGCYELYQRQRQSNLVMTTDGKVVVSKSSGGD